MELLQPEHNDEILSLPSRITSYYIGRFNESVQICEKLYERNKRWIVTYSGGKDSTALVVLALYVKALHPDLDINVTYADTMMEIPQMVNVARRFLEALEKKYPAKVKIVYPDIEDTYWVRMIGRGYPPPGPRFRWCTPKIKIKPSRKFHDDKGLFITGMRIGESQQRDIRLKNSCLAGDSSECGSDAWAQQNGIDVAAPLINWTAQDVWYFLMKPAATVVPEVQYVVDLYGNTAMRFGCWMCTVVMKDRTMIALAKSGDERVKKLLAFREWIVEESKKTENRYLRNDGKKGRLQIQFRERILNEVIRLQQDVNIPIITQKEIDEIRALMTSGRYLNYMAKVEKKTN